MIRVLQRLSTPIIESHDGVVIKTEADNLFAVLETATSALETACGIVDSLAVADVTGGGLELYASIGIGFGRILQIGHERIVGSQVNLAFKLGEDVAERGEVLLTEAAHDAIGRSAVFFDRRTAWVSGVEIHYYAALWTASTSESGRVQ